jgi:hypothetical protein
MVVDWIMEPDSDAPWPKSTFAAEGIGVSLYRWFENETEPAQRDYALMAHGRGHTGLSADGSGWRLLK